MSEAAPKVGGYYVEARDTMARAVSVLLASRPDLAERLQACNTPAEMQSTDADAYEALLSAAVRAYPEWWHVEQVRSAVVGALFAHRLGAGPKVAHHPLARRVVQDPKPHLLPHVEVTRV